MNREWRRAQYDDLIQQIDNAERTLAEMLAYTDMGRVNNWFDVRDEITRLRREAARFWLPEIKQGDKDET